MPVSIADLVNDLTEETAVLTACLDSLAPSDWARSTPAEGWTVLDQITHLAFFDGAVTTAVTDPGRFRSERDEAMREPGSFVDRVTEASRTLSGTEVAARFSTARAAMVAAFLAADPRLRVPWYGPEMSIASALTARIMETWAHGQDVYDGLGLSHPVTVALRQVAHIGVRALPNSFTSHGREVPAAPVRVELVAPNGESWVWGPDDASDRVQGPATDFCLVVTQRRHRADTAIITEGVVADEWISIAQAFAGEAGTGRAAGQFA